MAGHEPGAGVKSLVEAGLHRPEGDYAQIFFSRLISAENQTGPDSRGFRGKKIKRKWLLSASGVMEARSGGFGYDDGSRRSAVAGEHEGFLSSWPQWTRSTSHPYLTMRSASPWCASTAGQRASVVLDAAVTW